MMSLGIRTMIRTVLKMMSLEHKGVILKTVLISFPLSKFKESSFPSRDGQADTPFAFCKGRDPQ
ncbi:MAG: hypothetical protein AVO34_02410 [Firmicutes bacterium ML8_F2]|jgi:hypothetical protein|nr:MAG: hypothetical protein AVO34_02410 [Firmicutes bacterium ML8_F2]